MTRHQPHAIAPQRSTARILLVHKMFGANRGLSHIGLGVAGINTARSLRAAGVWADVVSASSSAEIDALLRRGVADARNAGEHPISHVVISAPWIPTADLQRLIMAWPDVHFAVVSHSNVGFLMADPGGIKLLREGLDLSLGHHNFVVAGNSEKFCEAWRAMYGRPVQWLPNLYDTSTFRHVGQRAPWHIGQTIRAGVFGATRPLKNLVSSAAAAVQLSGTMRSDVEIWRNVGRTEGGGTVPDAIQQLVAGLPHCKVVDVPWSSWPQFRSTISRMSVLLCASYTESFNMVTADGVAEGVASVVSDAIDWAPADWVAPADDVAAIARVARRLLQDAHAVDEGQAALRSYVARGLQSWLDYLV